MSRVPVYVLMLVVAVNYSWSDSPHFRIKHSSSGKYIVYYRIRYQVYPLRLSSVLTPVTWTFEKQTNHWGYIKDVSNGWIIHPFGGSANPGNGVFMVADPARHWGALWAFDAIDDHIIHIGGRYAHARSDYRPASELEYVTVHSSVHHGMKFQLVSPSDGHTEVLIYEKPTITGRWKMINMVRDPIATHRDTMEITIGRSETESRTTSFKYSWEVSAGLSIDMFSASTTQSIEYMMQHTSSSTWSEQVRRTRQIRVDPGQTVVTWQYVFEVVQNLSKGVFKSNLLADTTSTAIIPDDIQYAV